MGLARARWVRPIVVGLVIAFSVGPFGQIPAAAKTTDPLPPLLAEAVLPVAYWQTRFAAAEPGFHRRNLALSRSSDSWAYYALAYGVDAYTAMYEATGQTRYLDQVLEYVRNTIGEAKMSASIPTSQYRDAYLGWVSQRRDVRGKEVPLFESYNWRYVTRLLRVMRQSPAVYDNPRYRASYERVLGFTETHIFDKWYRRGAEQNIYRSRTHMAAHWAYIALDLSLLTSVEDRRERYREVFDNINLHLPNYRSSLRDQLRVVDSDPPAYFWSAVWEHNDPPGQDVAHGNGVISYIVEAHDLGQEWNETDIEKFSSTLTTVIWPEPGVVAGYVDGSGEGTGWFSDGFVKLGRYDPLVQIRLQTHPVQTPQYHAAMAVNARVLGSAGWEHFRG